jgi:hypothetical protein
MLGEAPEEAEGEGGVEDGVDGPQEHHVRPHPVPSAARAEHTDHSLVPWHCKVYPSNLAHYLMQFFGFIG